MSAGTRLGAWPAFVAWLCRTILRILVRVEVHGLDNVPRSGPLIIAPNHLSNADPPLVGGWLAPALGRRPRFLAKEQLFRGVVGWFLRGQGVIPVRAGGADMDAYRAAREVIAAGEPIFIFPEGTRSRDGTLGAPRPGVTLLATRHAIPILPVGVSGTDAFLPPRSGRPHFRVRVMVRVGTPWTPSVPEGGDRRAALAAADAELMLRIAALVEPRHRGRWGEPRDA
ncbi:MAG: lysophospholipid acyltransferase family protein [Chloroflexota bacterium]